MNSQAYVVVLVCLPAIVAAGWAAWAPLPEESSADPADKIEDLLPLHTQHFPQLKQSLDSTDKQYIGSKLSGEMERVWREERVKILDGYLDGLASDFGRVVRLGRAVESLTPDSARGDELERRMLAMRFRLHYRILSVRILGGGAAAVWQLGRLTGSVGSLSALTEAAMLRLENGAEEAGIHSKFSV
jgi:hypothetical protein